MTRALITTTINVPKVLADYAEGMDRQDDMIIVVGDKKSPHSQIIDLLDSLSMEHAYYLKPEDQGKWKSSEAIGWNCIQRRNIGILEAIAFEPDYITTVDDDNFPKPDYFERVDEAFGRQRAIRVGNQSTGWYNVGRLMLPNVVHRGYPYSMRHVSHLHDEQHLGDVRPGVVAGLWLGDPDIDAAERMVNRPDCFDVTDLIHQRGQVALDIGTWCPFNSQNTSWLTELAPLMFCMPHVGRFDDIWASYVARKVMDHLRYHALYGEPIVKQNRNEHNLVDDLKAEIYGYEHTDVVVHALRELELPMTDSVLELLDACFWAISPHMPNGTKAAFACWMDDCETVVVS